MSTTMDRAVQVQAGETLYRVYHEGMDTAVPVDKGGTGASTAAAARANLGVTAANIGALPTSGGTATGNITVQGSTYPAVNLAPTSGSTTYRGKVQGSYQGASGLGVYENSTESNGRMIEVRAASAQSSLADAVVLKNTVGGSSTNYRIFHAGTTVPVSNGGTGATTAKGSLSNLGVFYATSVPSSGSDGQICLVPISG